MLGMSWLDFFQHKISVFSNLNIIDSLFKKVENKLPYCWSSLRVILTMWKNKNAGNCVLLTQSCGVNSKANQTGKETKAKQVYGTIAVLRNMKHSIKKYYSINKKVNSVVLNGTLRFPPNIIWRVRDLLLFLTFLKLFLFTLWCSNVLGSK